MMLAGLILAAALAGQGAEAAKPATTQPEPSAAAKPAKPAEPKKICVTEAQMGSHMKKRVCATQEEWDRRQERDAAEMAKMQERAGNGDHR